MADASSLAFIWLLIRQWILHHMVKGRLFGLLYFSCCSVRKSSCNHMSYYHHLSSSSSSSFCHHWIMLLVCISCNCQNHLFMFIYLHNCHDCASSRVYVTYREFLHKLLVIYKLLYIWWFVVLRFQFDDVHVGIHA